MIDYEERVRDVCELLAHEWGIDDPELVEILLASRLECRLPNPWIIFETDYF